ncbi:hypothetical protein [Chondromyces crocatus]|uniref:Uncharacterized protein n=1 Tax=Chondromyces crocatus TaxID=52 RepID=A0A0K1ESJ6_CHOCO|nr:hypothetical protein [Chondromyces crocatus]AKT43774.1 uncharacterized protein CMC5_080100 [Chondromyces crocatus]
MGQDRRVVAETRGVGGRRGALAGWLGALVVAGCGQGGVDVGPSEEPLGESVQSVVTQCIYLDPALTPPLPVPVDFERELVITDLAVVDDPCLTTWSTACPLSGAWTFGQLMIDMAGATPPEQFVAEWLHQWEVSTMTPTGVVVPPRAGIRPQVIDPWLVVSGCTPGSPIVGPGASCLLDLKQAPFRLLGIVNRVDEDVSLTAAGGTTHGEARFVFGFVDPLGGNPLQATVILEYKLPTARMGLSYKVHDWAHDWHFLSDPSLGPIGSPQYMQVLYSILHDITSPGVEPGNPNFGSAIGQVRTNEIDFGGGPWKLREHTLQDVGLGPNDSALAVHTLALTPDDGFNLTPALDAHLQGLSLGSGSPVLMDYLHTSPPDDVPSAMLAGESSAPLLWDHSSPGTLLPEERHHFALATCNGCHLDETQTPFVHLSPRSAGVPTTLSPFLSTPTVAAGAGLPMFSLSVPDPAGSGTIFDYNEPWRRMCEVTRILTGVTTPYTRANGAH